MGNTVDKEILEGFVAESKILVQELIEKLESLEGHPELILGLADYGNLVDRIMGGAKSLALSLPENHPLHVIADYTAICKAVGYKGSQIRNNENFFNVVLAFLLDATEILAVFLEKIDQPIEVLKENISSTFIDRLKWLSHQFNETYAPSVRSPKKDSGPSMTQNEIDNLMKKLGL